MTPARISASTAANRATRLAAPTSAGERREALDGAAIRRPLPVCGRPSCGAHAAARLLAQVAPDLGDVAAERIAGDDLGGARTRQVDVDHALDAPRPVAHDQDAVGELHGFGDVVGDEQDGLVELLLDLAAPCRPAAAASARRARRTARPSAGSSGRSRARGRSRRAGACRPTARTDSAARSRRGRRCSMKCMARSRRSRLRMPWISSGNATLSSTVRQGKVDSSWNTMPMAACGPATASPSTSDAALGRRREPADDVEDRRLAAARRPDQRDELALRDRERDAVDGGHEPLRASRNVLTRSSTSSSGRRRPRGRLLASLRSALADARTSRPRCAALSRGTRDAAVMAACSPARRAHRRRRRRRPSTAAMAASKAAIRSSPSGNRPEPLRALRARQPGNVDVGIGDALADPLVLDRPAAHARDALLVHLVVVEGAVVGDDDQQRNAVVHGRPERGRRPSGSRRRRRCRWAGGRCRAAPAPRRPRCRARRRCRRRRRRPRKSSGWRNGQSLPSQDSGRCSSETSRPSAARRSPCGKPRDIAAGLAGTIRMAVRRGRLASRGVDCAPRQASLEQGARRRTSGSAARSRSTGGRP